MIEMEWQGNEEYGIWRAYVQTGGTSDAVYIPYNVDKTTVSLYPSNRARVEYTVASPSEIEAGTAEWIVWPLKTVRKNSADGILSVVTAVRAVSIQGTVEMEVVAK